VATNRGTTSRFALSLILLSSITLLALGTRLDGLRGRVRDSFRPARNLGSQVTRPLDNAIGKARLLKQVKAENLELRKQLSFAIDAAPKFQKAVAETRQLLKNGKFTDPESYASLDAKVVSLGGNNFEDKIELNVGKNQGIEMGAAVVSDAGLVGRVVRVFASSCDVSLITDPELSVGVRLSKSGDVGLARGVASGKPMRLLLPFSAKPLKKEILVTSGLQRSAFPPDIPVASVRAVKRGPLQYDIQIDPVVDLRSSNLSAVKVLLVTDNTEAKPVAKTEPIAEVAPSTAKSYREFRNENAQLRRALEKARASALRYDNAVREAEQLVKLAKYVDPDGYTSVNARVVSLGGSNFEDRVELDVGSDEGVVVGAPIVTEAGLVGKVIRVDAQSSDAALITDPELMVGVRLQNSGEVGVMRGTKLGNPLQVDLIALDAKPELKEVLVTSGFQRSAFPPDIKVARVRTVKPGAIQLEMTATPIVDVRPSNLAFIKVLLVKSNAKPLSVGERAQ
jgi:rod shape-determining protein MreC